MAGVWALRAGKILHVTSLHNRERALEAVGLSG